MFQVYDEQTEEEQEEEEVEEERSATRRGIWKPYCQKMAVNNPDFLPDPVL